MPAFENIHNTAFYSSDLDQDGVNDLVENANQHLLSTYSHYF